VGGAPPICGQIEAQGPHPSGTRANRASTQAAALLGGLLSLPALSLTTKLLSL